MDLTYKHCIDCGIKYPKSMISKRGLCPACGKKRQRRAAKQIRAKRGPIYRKYKTSVAEANFRADKTK